MQKVISEMLSLLQPELSIPHVYLQHLQRNQPLIYDVDYEQNNVAVALWHEWSFVQELFMYCNFQGLKTNLDLCAIGCMDTVVHANNASTTGCRSSPASAHW